MADLGIADLPLALFAAVLNWLRGLLEPISVVRECIQKGLQGDKTSLFTQFWAVPVAVILVTNWFVLDVVHIEIKSRPVLFILYVFIACGRLILEAFILISVLRLFKLRIPSGLVLVCYTIEVVYAPLFSWINVPTSIRTHEMLLFMKSQNVTLENIIPYFFQHIDLINQNVGPPIPAYNAELAVASWCMNLLAATLVAECISQAGKIERRWAYICVILGQVGDILSTVGMTLAQIFLTFTYMNAQSG